MDGVLVRVEEFLGFPSIVGLLDRHLKAVTSAIVQLDCDGALAGEAALVCTVCVGYAVLQHVYA